MAAKSSVTIEGMQDVLDALRATPGVVREHLVDVITTAKVELAQRTAQAAPVDTGALRQALQPSPRRGLTGFVGIEAGLIRGRRPDVYWRFVEFGTATMAARPYVVPTAEQYGNVLVSRIQKTGQFIERDLHSRGQRFL